MMQKIGSWVLLLGLCCGQAMAKANAIVSGVPWFDQNGKMVSAHGAGILKDGDRFYLFGEFKSDEGNAFKGFSCYSSLDLCSWTFENIALPVQESGRLGPNTVGERPKVMKCPKTGQYVMFMHTDDINYKDPSVGYATCDTIDGEYTFQGVLTFNGGRIKKWDMGVFQDDDGSGYLITHSGNLYKLSDDYTSIEKQVVKGMTGGCESPAIFKCNGVYYWLGSGLTGWERNDNYYFTATSLEGPWESRGNFAPKGTLTWNSQTTCVLPIVGAEETTYMFMGDRWAFPRQNSAATYVWQPLVFEGDSISLPEYRQSWSVDIASGKWVETEIKGTELDASKTRWIHYSKGWNDETSDGFSEFRSDEKGATCSLAFKGTRIALYGVARPDGGFGRVEIEDASGTVVESSVIESYCAYPESSLKFLSPELEPGAYKLTVTVLGEHFNWTTKSGKVWGSTGDFVSIERFAVQNEESEVSAVEPTCFTVGLIGDSTVATKYGWGPAFAARCNEQLTVLNYAKNGATLASLSDQLDELLEQKPDYVLIQFGHNDQKKYGTEEYSERLKSYIDRIKAAGGKPIVLSSVTRRVFGDDGKIEPRTEISADTPFKADLPTFARAAQAVSAEEEVPFIDLYSLSVAHHNQIGPEASAAYNYKGTDTTHFSSAGAGAIAELILPELGKAAPDLRAYITGIEGQKVLLPDFYADPTARVFNGTMYVYPTHDPKGATSFHEMVDWHVFSSDDLESWVDHGVQFSLEDISWADQDAWASDCIERNGKYYYYFTADNEVGVAVSDSPTGPFQDALGEPLVKRDELGIHWMLDPCVFIDGDGQAYLYVGGARRLAVVKLNDDMISRDGPLQPVEMENYFEGIWVHKRNGIYYASYPIRPKGQNANVMAYSMSDSPLGPWEYKGEIIDNHSLNVHGSITEFDGQWYLVYHIAGPGNYERRVCIAPLEYNEDGTIQPIR